MKTKFTILISTILVLFYSCKKQEVLNENIKVVELQIRGYIMTADTLEFIDRRDSVICRATGSNFIMQESLFNPGDKIEIRKADGAVLAAFEVNESPYNQVKRVLYDGTSFADNIQISPVSDPLKAGVRLSFTCTKDFGGEVDIQLFDKYFDSNTSAYVYVPHLLVKNASGVFGNVIELPAPETDHTYAFQVYKPGTTDLPYTNPAEVNIPNPATTFGTLPFEPGTSKLLSISPRIRSGKVSNAFIVTDLTEVFK